MPASKSLTAPTDVGEVYPIRTVASLTGVNPITLRAWERRYGLVTPIRTPSGRRMYTREHIDRLNRVVALLGRGVSISQAARSLDAEPTSSSAHDPWRALRDRMIAAIVRFDESALDAAYNDALGAYPMNLVTRQLIAPLLTELGQRWQSHTGSIAEEHFFSMYARNKLGARFHHRPWLASGPKFLGVCAPGEQHEIGLLLFALAAHEAGLRSVLLGANTPFGGLAAAQRQAQCGAIVISSAIELPAHVLEEELPALAKNAAAPVFIGGITSARQRDAITAAGAVPLGVDIPRGVHRLAAELFRLGNSR